MGTTASIRTVSSAAEILNYDQEKNGTNTLVMVVVIMFNVLCVKSCYCNLNSLEKSCLVL